MTQRAAPGGSLSTSQYIIFAVLLHNAHIRCSLCESCTLYFFSFFRRRSVPGPAFLFPIYIFFWNVQAFPRGNGKNFSLYPFLPQTSLRPALPLFSLSIVSPFPPLHLPPLFSVCFTFISSPLPSPLLQNSQNVNKPQQSLSPTKAH